MANQPHALQHNQATVPFRLPVAAV